MDCASPLETSPKTTIGDKCQPASFSTSTLYISAIQKKILRAS